MTTVKSMALAVYDRIAPVRIPVANRPTVEPHAPTDPTPFNTISVIPIAELRKATEGMLRTLHNQDKALAGEAVHVEEETRQAIAAWTARRDAEIKRITEARRQLKTAIESQSDALRRLAPDPGNF